MATVRGRPDDPFRDSDPEGSTTGLRNRHGSRDDGNVESPMSPSTRERVGKTTDAAIA